MKNNNRSLIVFQKDIIKTKNTEILPFPLIFMGTLVSFQWLLYGFIIDNTFIVVSIFQLYTFKTRIFY